MSSVSPARPSTSWPGSALLEIPQTQAVAIEELQRATELYAAGPGPGEQYNYGCVAVAHIDLATVSAPCRPPRRRRSRTRPRTVDFLLANGSTDSPPRLTRVRSELARNPYQGSPQATELDEQIEDFTRETIVRDLHDLPAGSD